MFSLIWQFLSGLILFVILGFGLFYMAKLFFGLMLMYKVIMLVFTLKNLTVRTKSISIIDVYPV